MDVLATVEPKILAVSFGAKANPEERVLAVAAEDGTVLACREVDQVDGTPAALSVMHIATTGVFRLEDRRKTEEWLNSGKASPAVGDALMQSDQIRLRGDRALIIADAKRLDEYLPGLAVFAYNEKQISDLEAKIARLWEQMRSDIPLTEFEPLGHAGASKRDRRSGRRSRSHSNEFDGGGSGDLSAGADAFSNGAAPSERARAYELSRRQGRGVG